jgi:hypothetical protein
MAEGKSQISDRGGAGGSVKGGSSSGNTSANNNRPSAISPKGKLTVSKLERHNERYSTNNTHNMMKMSNGLNTGRKTIKDGRSEADTIQSNMSGNLS